MKARITRQTFIGGRLALPGDVVDVDPADFYGNLLEKAEIMKEKPKPPPVKKTAGTSPAKKAPRSKKK